MGRPGELYDQDELPPEPDPSAERRHAGRGGFYDQDDRGLPATRRRGAWPAGPPGEGPPGEGPPGEGPPGEGLPDRPAPPTGPPPRPVLQISSRTVPPPPPPPARMPAPDYDEAAAMEAVESVGAGESLEAAERRPAVPVGAAGPQRAGRLAAGRPGGASSTGRATAVLAVGTFASRLTGFLRVLATGYVLGVSSLSDAFNYANGVPNIIYDLLLGGILSATLIPVFVEQLRQGNLRERSRAVSAVLTAISLVLIGVTALLWLAAPVVIHFYLLLNHSATGAPERALATKLLRYFAPQVFFLGAIVTSTALLNARRRFTGAALSPVLNNLVAIGALLATKVVADRVLTARHPTPAGTLGAFSRDHRAVLVLGLGTTAGYVLQLLVQLPSMGRLGLRLRPVFDLHHPAVRRVAALSSWLVGVVVANQVSLAVVMVLAGSTSGGITAYQFSYQFFQLPYALVVVSVASAIMPDLAERWVAGEKLAFERQFITGLRVSLAVIIPATVIYIAVAQPFIDLAIHHGRVGQGGARLVTDSLVFFVAGLPGFSAFFLLMRAYQAAQDARGMFGIYVLENALTVVAALILNPLLGVPGLALAWVAPYSIAAVYAAARLRTSVGSLGGWLTIRALLRISMASGLTGAVVVAVGLPFRHHSATPFLIARLLVQTGAGLITYLWLGRTLRIRELRPVIAMARRVLAAR